MRSALYNTLLTIITLAFSAYFSALAVEHYNTAFVLKHNAQALIQENNALRSALRELNNNAQQAIAQRDARIKALLSQQEESDVRGE